MSNADVIGRFLLSKINDYGVVAGILGNLMVESGLNPGAYNAGEGAIGIAQWEGGRRTALQQFARANGGSETDLNTQLEFLWHELTAMPDGTYSRITEAGSPEAAASAFDEFFERSSGAARSQRVNYASQFYANYHASKSFGTVGSSSQGGGAAPMSGGGGGGTQDSNRGTTESDYKGGIGVLAGAIGSIPELRDLLQQAEAGSWTVDKFVNEVENSHWYRTNAATIREGIALQTSDPATYKQKIGQSVTHVEQIARRLGVNLTPAELQSLGSAAYLQNLDDATIEAQVGQHYMSGGRSFVGGQSTVLTQQIKQLATEYGVPVTDSWVQRWVQRDLVTGNGVEGATADLMKQASSLYPGLASEIAGGATTQQIAQPYIASASQLLELPSTQFGLGGHQIQKALTWKDPTTKAPAAMPLWMFQDQLRQDPRWDKTDNARQSAYDLLQQVGSSWGFAS